MTPNVLSEFFQSLNSVSNTGYITLDQFIEYYSNIAAFEEDAAFEALMKCLWKAAPVKASGGAKSIRNLSDAIGKSSQKESSGNESYLPALQQLKSAVRARGATGIIGMGRAFRIIDDDGSKSVSLSEFKKAMSEYRMSLTDQQLNQIFNYFDKDKNGTLSYDEFIQALRVSFDFSLDKVFVAYLLICCYFYL